MIHSNIAEINNGANQIDKFIWLQLRRKREMRHLSLMDVSGNIGVSYQQLQKYEQAKSRLIVSMLYRLVMLYGLDFSHLFDSVVLEIVANSESRAVNCMEKNKCSN